LDDGFGIVIGGGLSGQVGVGAGVEGRVDLGANQMLISLKTMKIIKGMLFSLILI